MKLRVEHIVDGKQVCRRCKINKPVSEFWKDKLKHTGISSYCNICSNLNHKEVRARQKAGIAKSSIFTKADIGTPEYKLHQRDKHIQNNYGISLVEYNQIFQDQKGCCAICEKHQTEQTRPMDIDHCHKSGKVRGLLCKRCNIGIGGFEENTSILNSAIKYIEKNKVAIKVASLELN